MVKIQLEFECLAPNGECHFKNSPNVCIIYIGEQSLMWICDCLMARKKEKASQSNGGEKHAI